MSSNLAIKKNSHEIEGRKQKIKRIKGILKNLNLSELEEVEEFVLMCSIEQLSDAWVDLDLPERPKLRLVK
ncbi:hypothetical protein [Leptospira mayottensis]|uniref:Uncharacterized protein n=3 Tax=Leptospira TaxID=171 RepID=A0AA87SV94_9LEPT|nr:hypothetical protein [Leptospira mayottensis]EMO60197.1 hypothetical protein LEP1GSC133_0100 [Leptospira borgpetersenii serovar Pomona str. 200901868]AXR59379.1 hypothetical protein DQM68_00200 [Leptospira mayottensis]AXR63161.1 hypothetical protein DQM28_01835 [Leptospira mayottensis]AZQ01308.1 hypothetical protein LEP1GSC190_03800 [Leptospira mayottensis 200901116]EKR98711.1 hypothetical protein LEP1GSC125_1246 [Leptospira mayottensis 200901122]